MRRVSYFATKLNSRDIKKCDCLWVPPVICSPLLAKQNFPRLRQLAFTDWETRSRLCLLSDWWEGGWGESNLPQKSSTVLSEPKFGPPPPLLNQFFSSYIRVSLVARRAQYNFIYVIWKLCLIIGILEEHKTNLLRAFLITRFPVVRWFLVLKHPY